MRYIHAYETNVCSKYQVCIFLTFISFTSVREQDRPISTPNCGLCWWESNLVNLHTSTCESPALSLCYGLQDCIHVIGLVFTVVAKITA